MLEYFLNNDNSVDPSVKISKDIRFLMPLYYVFFNTDISIFDILKG